jgi:pimeloyl-ACP methyl ester carboxylesterase
VSNVKGEEKVMTTTAAAPAITAATHERTAPGHLGLVVVGSITTGLVFGLLLVLAVFAGGPEHQITGGALVALGAGFVLLAAASRHLTDQPQRWALPPGVAFIVGALALLVLAPSDHVLALAGWVWPPLLLALVAWSFWGARRSLDSWSRRAAVYPAFLVLALIAGGGAFETVAESTSSNPAPSGRTYPVNGHRLYMNCAGSGTPTVVLFNGLGERTTSWAWVKRNVSSYAHVCTFDRAGEGWSGAGAGRQDGHQLAADLHRLLRVAHVPAPYVLAGHSVGGVYALAFAAQYPQEVAGVALIDSATPYQFDLPDYPGFYSMWRRGSGLVPSLARAGLARITSGTSFATLPPKARREARAFASSPRELRADRVEFAELPTVFEQAKALKSLDDKPFAVLTAERGAQRGWFAAQEKLARLSTNSVQQTVAGATHVALLEDEGFARITARAIRHVIQFARPDADMTSQIAPKRGAGR